MKRTLSLFILFAVTIFVLWSTMNKTSEERLAQVPKNQRFVELFMETFKLTAMDETGAPSYTLNGERLEKFNNSDDTEIRKPVFHMLQPEKQWVVSADFALLNDKDETIMLKENVVMQQQNTEPAVTIRTPNMMIYTRTQIAKTKAPVEITQGNSQIHSIGMIYNNITSDLELSSDVNGYYLPFDQAL
ncbi:MAG: LPS export ABC transporter periplasmic protein LptC [Proteobacteria bacterium]|nr:LPS export ABC transporter periplasmic protein LptC [Pseudomonadota bacterium]